MFDIQSWLRKQCADEALVSQPVDLSRLKADDEREWLETNGLGSYASGSISTANTRRYHGLLVASLNHPVNRVVLLSHIDEVLSVGGESFELSTNLWRSDVTAPEGYRKLESFTAYPVPTWVFRVGNGVLIKQVCMLPGEQRVAIGYTWLSDGKQEATIALNLVTNYRDFHAETRGWQPWQFKQEVGEKLVTVRAFDGASDLLLRYNRGHYLRQPHWYWGYRWPRECERGLNDTEDCYRTGTLTTALQSGQSVTLVAEAGNLDGAGFAPEINRFVQRAWEHKKELLRKAGNPQDSSLRQLVLAADAFVVKRSSTAGSSVIAGYHWFNDWGRDSMISLPGLTLSSGRPEVAKSILETFGRYVSDGMLPNNFPDSGQTPEYNTIDATLWWGWSLHRYYEETLDLEFMRKQLALLDGVVEWHSKGARHNIKLDQADGLIAGGDEGVQLTWMDAKVGDFVVTPRRGKPVEISALWYNLLKTLAKLHRSSATAAGATDVARDNQLSAEYEAMAERTAAGLQRFWNDAEGCLFDVINDGDGTLDGSIRPNQLFAISLPFVAFDKEQARSILAVVEKDLLTPYGLRTLSPRDSSYKGTYGNGKAHANQWDRDITYHQGIAWPWLVGAWVDARLYAHGETLENVQFILKQLEPLMQHLQSDGAIGSVSEIFDGDAPYVARGCVAQAWSVAELLRTRKLLISLQERLTALATAAVK